MQKAIESNHCGTVGHMGLGTYGCKISSFKHRIHGGDTVLVRAFGNMSVRMLGIDTPEVSFRLPSGKNTSTPIATPEWEAFLSNPFDAAYELPACPDGLKEHLMRRLGNGCAINQAKWADIAQDKLQNEVYADVVEMQACNPGLLCYEFMLFLHFSHEVMDEYGRFLCFLNREDNSTQRPMLYNERMLKCGYALPYFIWPNINPFRRQKNIVKAVPEPGQARKVVEKEPSLAKARQWVKDNRSNRVGIFERADPLRLEPFEVRFLAKRTLPKRWVIDLGGNSGSMIRPDEYYTVPNPEDRLFIPEEYVPLFLRAGWKAPGF